MTEKKPPQTPEDVLRELHEFLLGDELDFGSMPIEQVQEYLKEEGVDPKPTIQMIRKRIAKAKGLKALKAAREKRAIEESNATAKGANTGSLLGLDREALWARLSMLTKAAHGLQEAAVYMRKFEDADEDDLRSLIEDMEALAESDSDED